MTKTFLAFVPNRFAKLSLPVTMPLCENLDRYSVWNFDFGSLGFAHRLAQGGELVEPFGI
jgi:hypothetical protein